jgi:mono/diheme cytochrome c family protein
MTSSMRYTALVLGLVVLACRPAFAQVNPQPRPPDVTDSAVAWGKALFHGSANCSACHGVEGNGTDAGPPLTGALWLHGPGTYEWLAEQIRRGIPAHRTLSGLAMPMRGWSMMNDDDVRAVAAYVWSITHPPRPPRPVRRSS